MTTVSSTVSTKPNALRAFVKQNQLISMYILMFVMAWSVMVPQALYSQGLLSSPLPLWLELLTGWAPGIAAVIVSAVIVGRDGVRKLLGRFLIWRVGLQWYILALFLLAAVILGGIGLHVLFGGAMPVIPAAGASVINILLSFALLIVTLLHASQNAWANLLSDNALRPFQFTVALMWMIALALILITKGKLGYTSQQDNSLLE